MLGRMAGWKAPVNAVVPLQRRYAACTGLWAWPCILGCLVGLSHAAFRACWLRPVVRYNFREEDSRRMGGPCSLGWPTPQCHAGAGTDTGTLGHRHSIFTSPIFVCFRDLRQHDSQRSTLGHPFFVSFVRRCQWLSRQQWPRRKLELDVLFMTSRARRRCR
jgi:hypothetical protein